MSSLLREIILVRQICILCLFYICANGGSGMLTGLPKIIQLVESCNHSEAEFRLFCDIAFIMTSTLASCKERVIQRNYCH